MCRTVSTSTLFLTKDTFYQFPTSLLSITLFHCEKLLRTIRIDNLSSTGLRKGRAARWNVPSLALLGDSWTQIENKFGQFIISRWWKVQYFPETILWSDRIYCLLLSKHKMEKNRFSILHQISTNQVMLGCLVFLLWG